MILFGYWKGTKIVAAFFVIALPILVIWGERDKKRVGQKQGK
jgi:hypothetical protein